MKLPWLTECSVRTNIKYRLNKITWTWNVQEDKKKSQHQKFLIFAKNNGEQDRAREKQDGEEKKNNFNEKKMFKKTVTGTE